MERCSSGIGSDGFHVHIQFYISLFNDDEVLLARQDVNYEHYLSDLLLDVVGLYRSTIHPCYTPLLPKATQACSCSILPETIVMDVLGLSTSMTSYTGTAFAMVMHHVMGRSTSPVDNEEGARMGMEEATGQSWVVPSSDVSHACHSY